MSPPSRSRPPFLALLATAAAAVLLSPSSSPGLFVGATDEAGMAFLAEKSSDPDVVTLPSGLMYKILGERGEGEYHPTSQSPCLVHYVGTLVDGTEFDSTRTRGKPATFQLHKVIRAWAEILKLMVEGDKFELYVPSDLGYGRGGSGRIPGNAALMFEIELLEIKEGFAKKLAMKCDPVTLKGCDDRHADYIRDARASFGGDNDPNTTALDAEIDKLEKLLDNYIVNFEEEGWINIKMTLLEMMFGPFTVTDEL